MRLQEHLCYNRVSFAGWLWIGQIDGGQTLSVLSHVNRSSVSRSIVLGKLYQTPKQKSSAGRGCLRFCEHPICSLQRSWLQEKGACMDTAFAGLFNRNREKCRRDGWYGGAMDLRLARSDHPQRRGFAYPLRARSNCWRPKRPSVFPCLLCCERRKTRYARPCRRIVFPQKSR